MIPMTLAAHAATPHPNAAAIPCRLSSANFRAVRIYSHTYLIPILPTNTTSSHAAVTAEISNGTI